MRAMLTAIALTAGALVLPSAQTTGYKPTPENLAARKWFQEARFGLFVHWGIYSQLADGEWVMNNRQIPAADYERVAASFNPVRFDADAWVRLVKAGGHALHHDHEQAP